MWKFYKNLLIDGGMSKAIICWYVVFEACYSICWCWLIFVLYLQGLLYSDPARWSLTFQTHVQLTMLDHHTRPSACGVKLMERSIFSGRYCFVENLHQSKLMEPAEFSVISEWFNWITTHLDVGVDLIGNYSRLVFTSSIYLYFLYLVYLRTKPEIVHQRILQRARKEEKTVPLSYIEALHKIHEDWLHHKTTYPVPAPVLEIDANSSLSEMLEQISTFETLILNRRNLNLKQGNQSNASSQIHSPTKAPRIAALDWSFLYPLHLKF